MNSIYIKFDDYVKIDHETVTIGDIAKVYSTNKSLASFIKSLNVYKFQNSKKRVVVTNIKTISLITEKCPNANIMPLGADETLILYDFKTQKEQLYLAYMDKIRAIIVSCILFFGSAFTIMAFNNDININNLFEDITRVICKNDLSSIKFLEFGYSIGIPLGITIFYNHFGSKKISNDPTPLEIEMRSYENEIASTLIADSLRKDDTIDVD